MQIKWTNNHE